MLTEVSMSQSSSSNLSFRIVLTVTGSLYFLMASSMLVRGAEVLGDFAVSPELFGHPVLQDFFSYFYQFMAFVGVLKILLGHVARERSTQFLVALVLFASSVLTALRDLSTSDSALGNRLYEGDATLVFVAISVAYALAYAALAWGARPGGPRDDR